MHQVGLQIELAGFNGALRRFFLKSDQKAAARLQAQLGIGDQQGFFAQWFSFGFGLNWDGEVILLQERIPLQIAKHFL